MSNKAERFRRKPRVVFRSLHASEDQKLAIQEALNEKANERTEKLLRSKTEGQK